MQSESHEAWKYPLRLADLTITLFPEAVSTFEDTRTQWLGDIGRFRMAIEDDELRKRKIWTILEDHRGPSGTKIFEIEKNIQVYFIITSRFWNNHPHINSETLLDEIRRIGIASTYILSTRNTWALIGFGLTIIVVLLHTIDHLVDC